MTTRVTKPISIPEPTNDVDSLWKTAQSLKEAVEIIQGIRGNRAAATEQDTVDLYREIERQAKSPVYPRTPAEITAGIVPLNTDYWEGNVLRYGAVGDGVTDDTDAFNDILTTGGFDVYIPAGTYIVDSDISATEGILVGSDTRIFCEPGVIVRIPNSGMAANRGFIRFRDESNFVLIGNHSLWEYNTKPTSDEGRHIFDIRGSSDVYIENVKAKKAGGDGFYVGEGAVNDYCTRVVMVNIEAEDCRRQGMSVIGAQSLRVYGARFIDIAGTAPEAGVDIEPDDNTAILEDIELHDIYTENCTIGVGIALQNHPGTSDRHLSIKILNPTDKLSDVSYSLRGGELDTGDYDGSVSFINPTAVNNVNGALRAINWPADGPQGRFINPTVINPNTTGSGSEQYGAGFYMEDDGTQDGVGFHGNILITNPIIKDNDSNITNYFFVKASKSGTHDGANNASVLTDSTASWTTNAFIGAKLTNTTDGSNGIITANTATTITATLAGGTDNDWDTSDAYVITQLVKDVYITGHMQLEGQSTAATKVTFDGSGSVSGDERRELITNQTSSPLSFSQANWTRYITNSGASGTVEIDLDNFPPGTPEVTFEVQAAQILRIDPDANSHIYPGSNGVGKYIESNNIGDRITLRRESRTEWYITEEIGTWTRQA